MRALSITVALAAAVALAGCSDALNMIKGEKGEAGEKGEPGPAGPPGPPGPAGTGGTGIRIVEGECSAPCTVACEANERILNTYAISPGGSFVFEEDTRATFRPQRQGVAIKVVLACIPK